MALRRIFSKLSVDCSNRTKAPAMTRGSSMTSLKPSCALLGVANRAMPSSMVWASLEVKKCGLCLKLKVLIAKAIRWQSDSSAKSLSKYSENILNAGNWTGFRTGKLAGPFVGR
jgi:hypothetical protein